MIFKSFGRYINQFAVECTRAWSPYFAITNERVPTCLSSGELVAWRLSVLSENWLKYLFETLTWFFEGGRGIKLKQHSYYIFFFIPKSWVEMGYVGIEGTFYSYILILWQLVG